MSQEPSGGALAGMRVLLLSKTAFDDPREGGTLRVGAIARRIAEEGADVDVVVVRSRDGETLRHPARSRHHLPRAQVAAHVASVGSLSVARWFSASAVDAIVEAVERSRPDVVLIEYSQLLIYAPLFTGIPIVCDLHNIEAELLDNYAASATGPRRLAARYEAQRVRRLEARALDIAQRVTTVSAHDTRELIRRTGALPDLIATAPNGVADEAFDVVGDAGEPIEVVFIANLGWQPNVDAIEWLVGTVWPLVRDAHPDARLRIVGRGPRRQTRELDGVDGITVHADVPATWPYLARATVATAPLQAAGGTRLKILEALATGTPVVATSLGALGLEGLAAEGVLTIEDDPARFAAALTAQPAKPSAIRAAAEAYRWNRTLTPLIDAVREARPAVSR